MGYGIWCPICESEANSRCRCHSENCEAGCANGHRWKIKDSFKKGPFNVNESDESKKIMDDLKRLAGIGPAVNLPPGGLRPFRPDPDSVGPIQLPQMPSEKK